MAIATRNIVHPSLSHYCLRCLTPAREHQLRCRGCGTRFEGADGYDLVAGPPPSREFAFLFTREAVPSRRAHQPYQAQLPS